MAVSVATVYDTVVSLLRKDKRGLSLSIDDFNAIIPRVDQKIYQANLALFEGDKLSMERVAHLKVIGFPISLTVDTLHLVARGRLPYDLHHIVDNPYYYSETYGRRKIDIVSSAEFSSRQQDFLTQATLLYPIAYIGYSADMTWKAISVAPEGAGTIYLDYLRDTVTPLLDYYVNDETLEIAYLNEGVGFTVPEGYHGRLEQAPGDNYTSATRDFEWFSYDLDRIVSLVLEAAGVQLSDQLVLQAAMADEQKSL